MFSSKWVRTSLPVLLLIFVVFLCLQLKLGSTFQNLDRQVVNASVSGFRLGTNLTSISYWSTELPFVDAFKSSKPWKLTQKGQSYSIDESAKLLELDKNGWVKSLPTNTQVQTLIYQGFDGHYPKGRYIVLYDGQGKINYKYSAVKDQGASTLGRDVLNVTPKNSGILLQITSTNPDNYIRNIRIIPEAYETTYKSQSFNPQFIEKIQPFGAIRFMDWMKTNNSVQSEWSGRPTLESARWSELGTPVEIMVELANRLDVDPWFNMPHQATDEYVTNFATYVRDHLKPNHKVYVEYTNEAWNPQFKQYHWIRQKAKTMGLTGADFFSKRTTEITQIWDKVFGQQKERVIGVMAAWTSNLKYGEVLLSYHWTNQPKSNAEYGIDAIAVTGYFGGYIGKSENLEQLESWIKQPDGGLNKLFAEITKGGVLQESPTGGALKSTYDKWNKYFTFAKQEKLKLLAYEGGQHLRGDKRVRNNQSITNLFIQANRDPRIGEAYRQLISKWDQLGGGLFMHFSDISKPNKFGSWGALEHLYQEKSPKYDALIQLINK